MEELLVKQSRSEKDRAYNKRPEVIARKKAWAKLHWKNYYQQNKSRLSDAARNRRQRNLNMRLADNIRRHSRRFLEHGFSKDCSSSKYLGCTVNELKSHLEKMFSNGMSWENYGFRGWHIDHIKPLSAFNLSCPDERKTAMHFTNLQPLWWRENLSKGGVRD